ncbi:hypothetical protein WM18_03595 [Burkholderia ubonensis]|nr:hypothetical protein WM17_10275 [Burkholderia ubonensis]KWN01439.1 hypothetical protein WM18_03595 [Burkholderia ubonensis]
MGAALLLPGIAHALPPSAGQSMRDIEATRPTLPADTPPDLAIPPPPDAKPPPASDAGPRVRVHAFVIGGNRAFDAEHLQLLLADLVGRELSFDELRQAADRISTYYREHGYVLARAYLPRQDIEGGTVRIDVLEGRYGAVELNNRSRVLDGVLRRPLAGLRPGDAVQGDALERSLLLLDDLPGVAAKGTLRPGAEAGTTDLSVDVERGPFASGSLDLDNYGDALTGRYRATGSVDVNAPLRLGDQFTLRGLTSDARQRYYRAAYQLPVGPASTRLGVAYSDMRYRVGGSFDDLDYHGRASVQSAFVAQPLLRSRRANVSAQLLYENKRLQDDYDAFDVHGTKRIHMGSLSLTGNNQDDWFGGGRSSASVTFGIGRMSGNDPLESDWLAKTHGRFAKLNVSALRLQALTARLQLYVQLSAQLASRNLDSSEKFSLGGPYGVRAYALGAGSGDQGWQASAELRYLAAPGWQVSTFVDTGRVQLNKQPWNRERNTLQLSSAGVGVGWYGASRQVNVAVSQPFGRSDDVAAITRSPGVWLQATQYF